MNQLPFRTNMTPTHSDGSPGVMLTKTPSSWACCRVELFAVKTRTGTERQAADRNVQLDEQMLLSKRQQPWGWGSGG